MVRWLMLAVLLTGIGWWVTGFLKRRQKAPLSKTRSCTLK